MTTPIFSDEVQLAGWSESHNSGAKVTFWLSDPAQLSAFRGMTERRGKTAGQRLAMVLVEINDDETLANTPDAPINRPGPLCTLAVQWCRDQRFWAWVNGRFTYNNVTGEASARHEILTMIGIDSRRELDTSPAAAKWFDQHIRRPFMAHLEQQSDQLANGFVRHRIDEL